MVFVILILWIAIYPVDSAIQLLNNRDLIGQLSRGVIGRLSVKLSCYWLRRLVMSSVLFDPSFVAVKQSSMFSQIVVRQTSVF